MHNERCTSGSGRGQAKPVVVKLSRRACSTLPYLPLVGGGWLYLASWLDLYSRRIVGWCVDITMEESLIIRAFDQTTTLRCPKPGLIIHSDQAGPSLRWAVLWQSV